jgi:exonuclease III
MLTRAVRHFNCLTPEPGVGLLLTQSQSNDDGHGDDNRVGSPAEPARSERPGEGNFNNGRVTPAQSEDELLDDSIEETADTDESKHGEPKDGAGDNGDADWGYEADEDLIFEEIQSENERRHVNSGGPQCQKNTRAALTIASLNMRGHGDVAHLINNGAGNKWFHVNQMLRDKKIGVLALQETHMKDTLQNNIEHTFKRICIFHCSDPDAPNSKGVAVVLNRDVTNATGATSVNIIPGRAMMVSLPWHANECLNILAVYAPNQVNESKHFWLDLQRIREEKRLPKPHIMLGDFNMVEDAIDRLPSHPDDKATVSVFRALKHSLHLIDG